jgi:hypothetical protein
MASICNSVIGREKVHVQYIDIVFYPRTTNPREVKSSALYLKQ